MRLLSKTRQMNTTTILASALSPFSARLRIAAALKGLDDVWFEPAPGGSGSDALKQINPFGQIPVLLKGGTTLVESLALLDFFEDAHPGALSLRPAGAVGMARVRMIGMLFDNQVIQALRPLFNQMLGAQPDVAAVHAALDEAAAQLEKLASFLDPQGPAVGGQLSTADCAMAPFAWLIGVVAPKFGATSPFERVPRIAQWWLTVRVVPEVQQVTSALAQALAAFMSAKK